MGNRGHWYITEWSLWEVLYSGCPVVSSNVSALPEQLGDASLLFDSNNIRDMAEKIYNIWTEEDLRQKLIRRGYERVECLTSQSYAFQWKNIIEEALENK